MVRRFSINEEGFSVRCILYVQDPAKISRVIVYGHGFGGHKDTRAAERFADRVLSKYKGAALLAFDWPAHGDDARKLLLLEDCDTYLRLVLSFLRKRYDPQALYGYATSFGGYLFLNYMAGHGNPFVKVALRSPAVTFCDSLTQVIMGDAERREIAHGKPVLAGFDRKVKISPDFLRDVREHDVSAMDFVDLSEQILILHGTRDEIIPMEAVRDFADRNLIEFIPVEGADHRFSNPLKMDRAIDSILRFFAL